MIIIIHSTVIWLFYYIKTLGIALDYHSCAILVKVDVRYTINTVLQGCTVYSGIYSSLALPFLTTTPPSPPLTHLPLQ